MVEPADEIKIDNKTKLTHFNTDKIKNLKPQQKYPRNWVVQRHRVTPDTKRFLSSYAVRKLPLFSCFNWKNVDVLKWIEKLGFPQYRNTFYRNMINGRTLLLVDASVLSRMNIKSFEHIQIISNAIRDLIKFELILFHQSISLPPLYPNTHFYQHRIYTGPTYELTDAPELFEKMKILTKSKDFEDHWILLTKWLQHIPDYKMDYIGYAPRRKLFRSIKNY